MLEHSSSPRNERVYVTKNLARVPETRRAEPPRPSLQRRARVGARHDHDLLDAPKSTTTQNGLLWYGFSFKRTLLSRHRIALLNRAQNLERARFFNFQVCRFSTLVDARVAALRQFLTCPPMTAYSDLNLESGSRDVRRTRTIESSSDAHVFVAVFSNTLSIVTNSETVETRDRDTRVCQNLKNASILPSDARSRPTLELRHHLPEVLLQFRVRPAPRVFFTACLRARLRFQRERPDADTELASLSRGIG